MLIVASPLKEAKHPEFALRLLCCCCGAPFSSLGVLSPLPLLADPLEASVAFFFFTGNTRDKFSRIGHSGRVGEGVTAGYLVLQRFSIWLYQ